MSMNENNHKLSSSYDSTSSDENSDSMGGQYCLHPNALTSLIDSTDDNENGNDTSTKATVIDNEFHQNLRGNKGLEENDVHLYQATYFTGRIKQTDNLLEDNRNESGKSSKRSSNDTIAETGSSKNSCLRRSSIFSKISPSSISTSFNNILISSHTKRLNVMSVKERQNAMYDLHGIPLDDEYYDTHLGVRGNTIERNPEELHKLLLELCRKVEERLKNSKSSYDDGDNFDEPDIFPRLTKEQQEELVLPPGKTQIPQSNNSFDQSTKEMDTTHDSASTPNYKQWIQQRVRFLKHELDDKDFGEGLRLAREQNAGYVNSQCIKFLRADRYDVNLASARMIRFFDTKRELFCAAGYNENHIIDRMGCLGRNLRMTDFSKEDLKSWMTTGFLQVCSIRDHAKRAIVVIFGKVITEANIPVTLVLRAYLYVCNLCSRDELTQRAGIVVIGYDLFTDVPTLRKGVSPTKQTAEGEAELDENVPRKNRSEGLIKRYLKQTYPVLSQIIKVGMSAQLRTVSSHYCYDHPSLNVQFEKLAGYMSTTAAARFRCHRVNTGNPETSIFRASGSIKNTTPNNNSTTNSNEKQNISTNINLKKPNIHNENLSQQENDNRAASMDSNINPHKELLNTLMTFGISRETIPINESTGEIKLEFHRALFKSIEDYEHQDRLLEEAATTESLSGSASTLDIEAKVAKDRKERGGEKLFPSLQLSGEPDNYWMDLTVSIGLNASFALFPNVAESEELKGGKDHSLTSLVRSKTNKPHASLSSQKVPPSNEEGLRPDVELSSPLSSTSLISPTDTICAIPQPPKPTSSNLGAPIFFPTPNDIIMGRGPWNRNHPGNLRLKAMLEQQRDRYESVNRFERMRIVDGMLNELFYEFGARFLYKAKTKVPNITTHSNDNPSSIPLQNQYQWVEAKGDKAHDKITHDFRNLRRQKQTSSKTKNSTSIEES